MDQNKLPAETNVQSPLQRMIGLASIVCLACVVVVYFVTKPWVEILDVPWVGILVHTCIPLLVTFMVLYRSHAREEMARVTRAGFLFTVSALIVLGVSIILIVLLFLSATVFANFGTGHP